VAEAVRDGETGIIVAPESPVAIAAAITALLADRAGLARLGEAARERARREYDWRENGPRLRDALVSDPVPEGAA